MSRHPLDMAFAKLERAKTHIQDLNSAVGKLLRKDPFHITSKLDAKGKERIWFIEGEIVPDQLECIAADAVHNIRTPLDKMLSADFGNRAIHKSKAVVGSIKFPVGDSRKAFEWAICGQVKHLTDPVIEFLEATQAYPGGRGELFFVLNKLDNADKHRGVLATTKLANTKMLLRGGFGTSGGHIISVGSKAGQHFVRADDGSLQQSVPARAPIYRPIPPYAQPDAIEFTSPDGDMEIMRTTPDAQVQVNPKLSLTVAFSELRGLEGEPVINIIKRMHKATEATLVAFRDRFF